jgi:hypothetical protein
MTKGYPWGTDRGGAEEWRSSVQDPLAYEQELARIVQSNMETPGSGFSSIEVRLAGTYPTTELIYEFNDSRAPGARFGFVAWVWEDPDYPQLLDTNIAEVINDWLQNEGYDVFKRRREPEPFTWLVGLPQAEQASEPGE